MTTVFLSGIGFVFVHEPDEIGGVLQSLVDGEEFQVFGGPVSEGLGRAVVAVFQRDEVGFVTGTDHVGKHLLLIDLASVFSARRDRGTWVLYRR